MILLTGGSGFVGSAVREAAARRALDLRAPSRAELDVLRPATLAPAMEGVDVVIHAAGAAHVFRRTAATDDWVHRTNVDGTRNVVAAARAAGVRHTVLVSSISVYGDRRDGYARSKAEAENVDAGAMTLTTLRLATAYGEGDRGNVMRLIRAIDRHRFVQIGRGENRKSLIHRHDAGEAIVTAAMAGVGGTFDVSAPPVTMAEIVDTIAHALGRRVPRLPFGAGAAKLAARALGIRSVVKFLSDDAVDPAPFCARFNFAPAVTLADGLRREASAARVPPPEPR